MKNEAALILFLFLFAGIWYFSKPKLVKAAVKGIDDYAPPNGNGGIVPPDYTSSQAKPSVNVLGPLLPASGGTAEGLSANFQSGPVNGAPVQAQPIQGTFYSPTNIKVGLFTP